jgi:Mrp family chromosome partitioning ATPase/capsular polysaccharide biosynthesis protein
VTKPTLDPARIVADNLDASPDISAETVIKKFVVRWRLIAACTFIVPLIAVGLSHLIPPVYKASAQLLIRNQGGVNALYSDVAPSQITLTGATSAELLRSTAVASQMVEAVGVTDADIARPAYKVLFGRAAALILPLLGRDPADGDAGSANSRYRYIALSNELKPSITTTTLMAERAASSPRDELIEITLKSTSREKVAPMVNGLCEAFIAEYNRRGRDEMLDAHKTLGEQAATIEGEIARLSSLAAREQPATTAIERAVNADNKPLSSNLARRISELESQLVTLRETFTEAAPEVVRLKAELEKNRAIFNNQEAIDGANELLSTIKKKQRQLLLAAQLFEKNQGNLSVAEYGLTPKKSKLLALMRYGIPALGGLAGGFLIGVVAALLLNLLDPRLLVPDDVAGASPLPLLGVIPVSGLVPLSIDRAQELPLPLARPALLQTLSKIDLLKRDATRAIAITSANNESDTAGVALQIAALLARDRERRVLLIDANFDQSELSALSSAKIDDKSSKPQNHGLLDVLAGQTSVAKAVCSTALPRLSFLSTGPLALRDEVGSNQEKWAQFWTACHSEYDTIVVHAGGLLNSREATVLTKTCAHALLVTHGAKSTRQAHQSAASLLVQIGATALGVIHCDLKQ